MNRFNIFIIGLFVSLICMLKPALAIKSKLKSNCSSSKEVQCNNSSKCIRAYQVCDGFNDCPDKSDENNCQWCNRTFNNEGNNVRIMIKSFSNEKYVNATNVICYYKINNLKINSVIGIRLKRFMVGSFDQNKKSCDNSWIEITETDSMSQTLDDSEDHSSLESRDLHSYMRIFSYSGKKTVEKRFEKVFLNENNSTSKQNKKLKPGRFCGSLNNLLSNYYSSKRHLVIKYLNLNYNERNSNDFFEFEITFHNSNQLNPHLFSKQKSKLNLKRLNFGEQIDNEVHSKCDRTFNSCSDSEYDACLIASPGYPGIYLKNQRCLYYIKNTESILNQKLILVNDNIQVDSQLCQQYLDIKRVNSQQSYFCDNGTRLSRECNDYLNIYDGMNTLNSKKISLALIKQMCGMGRMPKIVTKKNALVLEFLAGSNGYFINTGFLFYAMNKREYLKNYNKYNAFEKNEIAKINPNELSSISLLDRLQIENCNSDMNTCVIQINDDSINQTYSQEGIESRFKIGHLYGSNMNHPSVFTLSYVLKTKQFNTIAIFLDTFQPKYQTSFRCEDISLTIETSNQLITNYHHQEYYDEYEDLNLRGSNDFDLEYPTKNLSSQLTHHTDENSLKSVLFRVCDPKEITSKTIRFFLIKSTGALDEKTNRMRSKTSILVNYFLSQGHLLPYTSPKSSLFDFKLSYEFFNFDWFSYQENTVCDFIYDYSTSTSSVKSGIIRNPQASIFYKTNDEKLKCKYKIIANENHYIKLTFQKLEFNMNNCENIFFDVKNESSNESLSDACRNYDRKIVIKELKHSIGKSSDSESSDAEEFYDNIEDEETLIKNQVFEKKMCICGLNEPDQVYVSKYDTIEIEYEAKLNKKEIKNYDFQIKYDFVDRGCHKLIVPNSKSKNNKGLIVNSRQHGLQNELIDMKANESLELNDFQLASLRNLNFHCKFHLKAPQNKYVYVEFTEFLFRNRKCNQNNIKLFSIFSKKNITNASTTNKIPFVSLCSGQIGNKTDKFQNQTEITFSRPQDMVTAHFLKEANINQTLNCYTLKNKLCFMSNEIDNELNPYTLINFSNISIKKNFYNEIIIDVVATELKIFNFEIKYHFFEIDFDKTVLVNLVSNTEIGITSATSHFNFRHIVSSDNCQFRCPLAKINVNVSVQICLDETLVCDNDAECILNDSDEINCPVKMNHKLILLVLCSVFSFTFIVLFLSFLYRNYINEINRLNAANEKYKNVQYLPTNFIVEN